MDIEYYDIYNADVTNLNLLNWLVDFYDSMYRVTTGDEAEEWKELRKQASKDYIAQHRHMIETYGLKDEYIKVIYDKEDK